MRVIRMYKDFKQSESLDTGLVGGSGILWMFSGIILGLLVGLGMYYFANNNNTHLSSVDTVQQKIASAQSAKNTSGSAITLQAKKAAKAQKIAQAKKQAQNAPRELRQNNFSYYAVLPNLDVPVGPARKTVQKAVLSVKDSNVNENIAQKVALLDVEDVQPIVSDNGDFLLQVASFKRKDRATKTIKRLNKKGVSAYIQKKNVKGRTWYRVIAGPVSSESADSWKSKAEKLGHRPIVLSVR